MLMFAQIDRVKSVYDRIYKLFLVICKLLLIADIAVVSFAVAGRYIPFIPDPTWSEEVTLTLMSYMAVLSAALAIRRDAHIRMTVFDRYLPPVVVKALDVVSDVAVLILALIMITVGWKYANGIGAKGFYSSLPWLSKRYMYMPIPLAGVAMLLFELEALYVHIRYFVRKEEEA